ncbi:amylosucrase [Rhizobium sp. CRIBSB]|nr:amylosucrase [Rhizobium sp. CRIBSB]
MKARLEAVYGDDARSAGLFDSVVDAIEAAKRERPAELRGLDRHRASDPAWTGENGHVVYTFYVDRFAGDLSGVIDRLDYLQSLGVRWLHPLPLLKAREGDSDGGFAVQDYREVEPRLGTMADLSRLAAALRARGMGLLLDVVCNHTAREHDWAVRARAGDPVCRSFYHVVESRDAVDRWEQTLVDVFPDTAPGSFTHDPEMGGWVWTTFYPFQWDLNYANPAVFLEMLKVLLFLSNQGVEGFRLDSAPFLWKRDGTHCRNQPEAYAIVEAWRAALSLAAPGVVLLAEAIESLDDVLPFFGEDAPGCHLAYNNGVMTALWGALADQDAGIARKVMMAAAGRPEHAAWMNYVRCHDDLIWNALSAYAPVEDLERWSRFYGGQGFSGGRAFQTAAGGVPSTNGMAAALTGLDRSDVDPDQAAARLQLVYGIIHALDGWPLIYMGDEIALGNDEAYQDDPERAGDGRWLHRPVMAWERALLRGSPGTREHAAFEALARFTAAAGRLNALGVAGRAVPIDLGTPSVLAFDRNAGTAAFRLLANLSPVPVTLAAENALAGATDVLTGVRQDGPIVLAPYGLVWLARGG